MYTVNSRLTPISLLSMATQGLGNLKQKDYVTGAGETISFDVVHRWRGGAK